MHTIIRLRMVIILIAIQMTFIQNSIAIGIHFDDSQLGILKLSNEYYELSFSSENGAILSFVDKQTNEHTTLGSNNMCLWGVYENKTNRYDGGCFFDANGGKKFEYEWITENKKLIFDYTSENDDVNAQITVTPSNASWVDFSLNIYNHWDTAIEFIAFPSDLLFESSAIQEWILPLSPGVGINNGFFSENRSYVTSYPAPLFADYTAVSLTNSEFTLYTLTEPDKIYPVHIGFIFNGGTPSSAYLHHSFEDHVASGDSWQSPTVRLDIGRDFVETAVAYRNDNHLYEHPSLIEKLGSQYNQIVRSPLLKADMYQIANQIGSTFSEYETDVFPHLPSPSIFHPVTFWDGEFDEQYPDLLPTNPSLGTVQELASLFESAKANGMLLMPYTNPTWWDVESPTTQSISQTIGLEAIVALDRQQQPIFETYNGQGGYVVSPHSPLVQGALQDSIADMLDILPSDILFEDQVGARPPKMDFNSYTTQPADYALGWLAHTERYFPKTILMTEGGYDALMATESGFHSSILLSKELGATDDWWGDDNWRPLPIATIMGRDKTLFYQHDLATETMTHREEVLAWNAAMGYLLSYDLFESANGGGLHNSWLDIVSVFQNQVFSHYASELVLDYQTPVVDVNKTIFQETAVITNWHDSANFNIDEHIISPLGMLVEKEDNSLLAGLFSQFSGQNLREPTYIVQNNHFNSIDMWHSSDEEIVLEVDWPNHWSEDDSIVLQGLDDSGNIVLETPLSIVNGMIPYTHDGLNNSLEIVRYRIYNQSVFVQSYFPMVFQQKVFAPDLIVEAVHVANDFVQITIHNQGDRPTDKGFWVDLYIDPDVAPTAVNQSWDQLGEHGLVWGVTETIPVNGYLTLTLNGPYFDSSRSHTREITPGTPIYIQLDSYALGSPYGSIAETHEIEGSGTNNIVFLLSGEDDLSMQSSQHFSETKLPYASLPRR